MEDHYLENPSLKETAAYISISPEYFSRLFKAALGKSYSEYQNRIKLRRAYQLLEQTNLSVRQLALKRTKNKVKQQFPMQYGTNRIL